MDSPVAGLSAPARRALANADLTSLEELSEVSANDLLKLHGFGTSSLPVVRQALGEAGLSLRDE